MSLIGPSVWTGRALQVENDDLEKVGLAHLYPAYWWSLWAPGHHGYPRAFDLIRDSAPKARWATWSRTRWRDLSPSPLSDSQTSAGKPTVAFGLTWTVSLLLG